jgi:hypothetical protein
MFFAFARRLGLSPEAAEDAVQESLPRLWAALQSGATIWEPDWVRLGPPSVPGDERHEIWRCTSDR